METFCDVPISYHPCMYLQNNTIKGSLKFYSGLCIYITEYIMLIILRQFDPERFWSCPSEKIELCDEGFNLDLESGFCEPRSNVNCDDRPLNFRDNMKELEKRLAEKINALNSGFTSSQTVSEVGSDLLPESLDSNLLSEVGETPGITRTTM